MDSVANGGDPAEYGDRIADVYDEWHGERDDTFFVLLTQEEQIRCFASVAASLVPGGAFAMEAFVPDLTLYDRGQQRVRVDGFAPDATRISATLHDRAGQRFSARHLVLGADGVQTYPVELRYAWPSELDLMARLAGMEPAGRWEGWSGRPFTSDSPSHVSVWRTPAP